MTGIFILIGGAILACVVVSYSRLIDEVDRLRTDIARIEVHLDRLGRS